MIAHIKNKKILHLLILLPDLHRRRQDSPQAHHVRRPGRAVCPRRRRVHLGLAPPQGPRRQPDHRQLRLHPRGVLGAGLPRRPGRVRPVGVAAHRGRHGAAQAERGNRRLFLLSADTQARGCALTFSPMLARKDFGRRQQQPGAPLHRAAATAAAAAATEPPPP